MRHRYTITDWGCNYPGSDLPRWDQRGRDRPGETKEAIYRPRILPVQNWRPAGGMMIISPIVMTTTASHKQPVCRDKAKHTESDHIENGAKSHHQKGWPSLYRRVTENWKR